MTTAEADCLLAGLVLRRRAVKFWDEQAGRSVDDTTEERDAYGVILRYLDAEIDRVAGEHPGKIDARDAIHPLANAVGQVLQLNREQAAQIAELQGSLETACTWLGEWEAFWACRRVNDEIARRQREAQCITIVVQKERR